MVAFPQDTGPLSMNDSRLVAYLKRSIQNIERVFDATIGDKIPPQKKTEMLEELLRDLNLIRDGL